MAFKRKETTVEAVDLNTITPDDAQRRIIAGVKKYATNEGNWSKADANTPYLGQIVGMGIESSNLADITMSIERQFLTRKTRRVTVEGSDSDFRLEDGELGKLRILEGQDAVAATAGLSVRMLMDLGHMKRDAGYLQGVASYACIVASGDGTKLNDALSKTLARLEKAPPADRADAAANLKSLVAQARDYAKLLADPAALGASREKEHAADRAAMGHLADELRIVNDKLKGVTTSDDPARVASLRSEEGQVKTRLKLMQQKLRVSEELARGAGSRTPVESSRCGDVARLLEATLAKAEQALAAPAA